MTTLQEALDGAIKYINAYSFADWQPVVMALHEAKAALAQQGEQPTQRQLDTAMRQWETWKAYALELQSKVVKHEGGSLMLLNAAAPVPQPLTDKEQIAQNKRELLARMESPAPQAQSEKELEFGFDTAPQPAQGAVTRRKIFVCAHCDGIYADQTVTQCDCMEGTGADFVEGFAEYPAALQSAQPVVKDSLTPQSAQPAWQTATQVLEARAEADKRLNEQLKEAMDAMPIAAHGIRDVK